MRLIFGFMALLIVLAVVGTLGKTQLSALGLTGNAATRAASQGSEAQAVTNAVMGRAKDAAATVAVPRDVGGMAGATTAAVEGTVPMQAQAIQNNLRDQTNAALQKGADRNNAAQQ
jgi:hypothetical protein